MQLWHIASLEFLFHSVATKPFKILIPSSKAPLVLYKSLVFCFQTEDAHLALKSYVVFQMLNLINVGALPAPLAALAVTVLNRTWSKANMLEVPPQVNHKLLLTTVHLRLFTAYKY